MSLLGHDGVIIYSGDDAIVNFSVAMIMFLFGDDCRISYKSAQNSNAISFLQSFCYENYLFQFAVLSKKSSTNKTQTQNGV